MSILMAKTLKNFQFSQPTHVVFGTGTVNQIGEQTKRLGITKPLVATDGYLASTDAFKAAIKDLENAGLKVVVWDGVIADPTDVSISTGTKVYIDQGCDGLVGYGGGSSMDSAKAIGALSTGGERINEYLPGGPRRVTAIPPLMCVPTTSGTGSEVTAGSVITDTENERKIAVAAMALRPRIAIVDPELTLDMPPKLTASTGMDAFSHLLESYTSAFANPMSDMVCLYGIELTAANLPCAVHNGQDMEARINMSLASLMGGLAIAFSRLHFGHAVGHALGAKFHIPHGLACALTLVAGMEYMRPAIQERLANLAEVLGVKVDNTYSQLEAAEAAIDAIAQLLEDIDMPSLEEAIGKTENDIPYLVDISVAEALGRRGLRHIDAEGYRWIFERTFAMASE